MGVPIVAAILAAFAGGAVVLQRAETGGAAASLDRRLTVTILAGTGTVTSSPSRISCPPTCSAVFPSGTSVTLTATPGPGFRFDRWGDFSGCTVQPTVPNECRVSIGSDSTVKVIFRPAATLHVFPNGDGVVTVSPAGLDLFTGTPLTRCNRAENVRGCRLAYLPGTRVTATAAPASGRTFTGWGDARCPGKGLCTVEAAAGEFALVATFNPLQLRVITAGSGIVTSSPAGISCGAGNTACEISAPLGARFVLNAGTGKHEWRFGCDPEGGNRAAARCTATVAALPTAVGISFGGAGGPPQPNRITVRLDVVRTGTVKATVRGDQIDCGETCSATYKFGDREELKPVDTANARFQYWVNGCGKTRVCRFPVGPITSLEAYFAPPLRASIVRLRVSGTGSQRKVVARIEVNRAASVSLRLRRNGKRLAMNTVSIEAGQTPVRVKVPRGAAAGTFGVVAVVKAGSEERRLVRSIRVGP